VIAAVLSALALAGASGAPVLPVSTAAGCTAAPTRAALVAGAWSCSITAAEAVALPGDEVAVAPGAYPPTRISASGATGARIVVTAAPGPVTIDAGAGSHALNLTGVHDVEIDGLALTGGTAQTVWIDQAAGIDLTGLTVSGSAGHGVQINDSAGVTIASSLVQANANAGIMETGADSGDTFTGDTVSGNGAGPSEYLGSGIEVGGAGTQILGCTITGNGGSRLFEHGVYVASVATGWLISGSTISGSSGADVKAGGSNGTITTTTLGNARLGVYARGVGVTLSQDQIEGSFRDGLVVAGGTTLLSGSVVSNDGKGYGQAAQAAIYYGGGRLQLSASRLYLRGVPVKPQRPR
jgi:hypothetical protein